TLALRRRGVEVRQSAGAGGATRALQPAIRDAADLPRHNSGLRLNIAFNYGGRAEIVRALRELVAEGVRPEEVTEEAIARHLYTAGLPDPDLVIRTAGEMRLSNFLLWQAAYAEYYATDKLWPDFTPDDLRDAVSAYPLRKRKY